jgi:TonB family protein
MGKIVKYCGKCEEGFAEKFGFCPNCGEHLDAFEMNPVHEAGPVKTSEASNFESENALQNSFETVSKVAEPVTPAATTLADTEVLELGSVDVAEDVPVEAAKTVAQPAVAVFSNEETYQPQSYAAQETAQNYYTNRQTPASDDGYHITVIEAKDTHVRNGLLAGFTTLALLIVMIGWVWALFTAALPVFALDEPSLFAFVGPIEDQPFEEEKPEKKKQEEGGGGGGGGQESQTDATKGRLPTQVQNPKNPLLMVTQMTNPTFVVKNETKGNITREPTTENFGLPTGLTADNLSGGKGTGGGIGGGKGTGAGGGIGGGEGNGIGNGSGNGLGDGNGDGTGGGDDIKVTQKKVEPVGVTEAIKILAKPQAKYTDAGRQNNVQGTVTLKVVFNANGTIGSISPVNGLPYGLTEQAIAAARQIKFDPPKRNGVPYSTSKTIQYSFTIY